MGNIHVELCLKYLSQHEPPSGLEQKGEASVYQRRRPIDSRLDAALTISEQFDFLRGVDNDKYPAFFEMDGHRFELRIEKRDVPD